MTSIPKIFTLIVFSFLLMRPMHGQSLVINEVMASNTSTLVDDDGDTPDWIELYNGSDQSIDLTDYGISDNKEERWVFPPISLEPEQHLLIYASDKDRANVKLYWETIIEEGDTWSYIVPTEETPSDWYLPSFQDAQWDTGASGFGYGDGDDATEVANVLSVFLRKDFEISDLGDVGGVVLDIDFDDSFVAYINGVEVARDNISSEGPPPFNQPADNYDHEANMYQGGSPDRYELEDIAELLVEGTNVIAIQVHNHSQESSDFTAIPFLSIGHYANADYYSSDELNFEHFGGLHTNFKISADGETLYLTDGEGSHVDSLEIVALRPNISYGYAPDGVGSLGLFDEPTPGTANGVVNFSGYSMDVDFSAPGGKYNAALELSLSSSDENATIYYTTDGSAPTEASTLYQNPISITSTTVVRAIVHDPQTLRGNVSSQTYLINTLHGKLPVVSLSTDPENLWNSYTGIYVLGPNAEPNAPHYGANFWMDWEIPMNIQLIESDNTGFTMNAGAKIFGGWSRANAQKSLAIHFRNGYDGALKYPLFPDQDIETYHSLVLRNSGNDWNRAMLRDGVIRTLVDESVDQQAFRPAVVYLNGEYWGILNIREKMNEDHLAAHHDLDAGDIHILEGSGSVVEGNSDHYQELTAFVNQNDLTVAENYDFVKSRMDIDNFIRYQVVNIFIDNQDWPGNNIKFWREDQEDSRWRWISYDREYSFNIYNDGNARNSLAEALSASSPDWPNPPWSTLLLRKLMENNSFRRAFLNFFADELNSTYQPASVIEQINYHAALIENEIGDHMERWGSNLGIWQNEIFKMENFAAERPSIVWNHLSAQFSLTRSNLTLEINDADMGFIELNSLTIEEENWSGDYFMGIPIEVKAVARPGYTFVRWEGDRESTSSELDISMGGAMTLSAVFEEAEPQEANIIVNEIKYKSSDTRDTEDWIELHNAQSQSVDLSGWALSDNDPEHLYLIPENTLIEGDGYLVLTREKNKFENHHSSVKVLRGDFDFGFSSEGDCVKLFDALGDLHDEVCYTNTTPWPTGSGDDYSIALSDASLDNSAGANWFAGYSGGTPGESNIVVPLSTTEENKTSVIFYPNPTRQSGTLLLTKRDESTAEVLLYDATGKVIEQVFEGELPSKITLIPWKNNQLDPGVYFFVIKQQNISETIRVIIE
jgi:hypothetical protein